MGVMGYSGTRKVRLRVGRLRRRKMTARLTSAKAKSVPMLVASASWPSGISGGEDDRRRATRSRVLARGVPVFG